MAERDARIAAIDSLCAEGEDSVDSETRAFAAQLRAILDRPGEGHLFRFSVTSVGRHQSPDRTVQDSDWEGDPWTLEVRAWSLVEALRIAADLGMNAWDMGED